MSDKSETKLDIDSMISMEIIITLLVILSLPISMSSSSPQKVTSTGHSTTNKSEIENLTIADAAIPTINSKTLDNIGNNLSSQRKYKLALTFYDRALAIDPYRFNALINKAFTLDNLSRYNESLAYYDKVLTLNPDEEIALNGKGEALLKLGNYDKAIPYSDSGY